MGFSDDDDVLRLLSKTGNPTQLKAHLRWMISISLTSLHTIDSPTLLSIDF